MGRKSWRLWQRKPLFASAADKGGIDTAKVAEDAVETGTK
jgi:hypothetical protein